MTPRNAGPHEAWNLRKSIYLHLTLLLMVNCSSINKYTRIQSSKAQSTSLLALYTDPRRAPLSVCASALLSLRQLEQQHTQPGPVPLCCDQPAGQPSLGMAATHYQSEWNQLRAHRASLLSTAPNPPSTPSRKVKDVLWGQQLNHPLCF